MADEQLILPPTYLKPPRRYSLAQGGCLLGIAIVLILALIAFLLPATVPNREVKERMRCANNLRQIGLALHNYAAKYGRFPPAYTVDKQGRRMHSWRALLRELVDLDLYRQYDFKRPWNSPGNLAFAKTMKKDGPYRCPDEDIKEPSWTSYVMLVGPTAFSNGPEGCSYEEIRDGTSNTIEVVEMSPSGILWTAPYDLNVEEMSFRINDPDKIGVRSCHSNGANLLFADITVRYLYDDGSKDAESLMKALTTINGGEDMSKFHSY
jgi:prepilin-type processing-associated H-X9-DG protein